MAGSSQRLSLIQQIISFAVIFLSIISSPRIALLAISKQANIPVEFLMLALALADFAALALVLVSGIRYSIDRAYRIHCSQIFKRIQWRFGGFIWIILILWIGLSTRWADNLSLASFNGLHVALALAAAFLLATIIESEQILHRVLWMLVASVLLQAAIGILQVIVQGPLGLGALGEVGRFSWDLVDFFRARGLTEHPNYLGGCLALGLFACIILLQSQKNAQNTTTSIVRQTFIVVIMAVLLAGLAGSLSRSAFVGTFIGTLPLLAWAFRHISVRRLFLVGIGIAVVVLAVGVVALRGELQNAETRLFGAREFFFGYSFTVIKQAPVLGVGAGNLMVRIGANEGNNGQALLPVHNVYLFIWAELGFPGVILFLGGCGIVLWRSRFWQIGQITPLRIWGCCFLTVCVIMLFDNYFWAVDPHRMTFFWVLGVWWGCAILADDQANLLTEPDTTSVNDPNLLGDLVESRVV